MKRNFFWGVMVMVTGMLAACGVPRQAATFATQAAASATMPASDDAVREQLVAQDAAWANLAALLQQREFGGIMGVDQNFIDLVSQTAAIAKRQHALIDQHQDDAAFNRQSLERFGQLWQSANSISIRKSRGMCVPPMKTGRMPVPHSDTLYSRRFL